MGFAAAGDRKGRPYGGLQVVQGGGPMQASAPTERFVGAGFSCPPLCRPIPGHCRARQSGHFLETGSLHPPLAALRRFPRPRATARVAPTKISEHLRRAACPHAAVMVRYRAGGGLRAARPTILAPCPIMDLSLQALFLTPPSGPWGCGWSAGFHPPCPGGRRRHLPLPSA